MTYAILFVVTIFTNGEAQSFAIDSGTGEECIAWLVEMERRDHVIHGFRSCEIDRAPESWK